MEQINSDIKVIESFVFIVTAVILLLVILFVFTLIDIKRKIYLEEMTIKVIKTECHPRQNKLNTELLAINIEIRRIKKIIERHKEKSEET